MSIQEIKKALSKTFQGMLKNIVSLANDSTLEKDFKVLKVGDKNTPIQLKENDVKINGSLIKIDTGDKISSSDDLTLDVDGDITLDADGGDINFKDNGDTIFSLSLPTLPRFTIGSPANLSDYFRIQVNAEGQTNIITRDYDTAAAHINIVPDGNLTLQSTGNIYLTPSTGNITLYDSGNSDDYVRMDIDANGGLEISTVDASGAGNADLTLDIMGNILLEAPVFMKETSAAATDITANGQLWVKDVNPNELWFTNDTGTDIQLTSGDQPNIRTAVITITDAEMDDLHNTPKELVAAGGPADVIIPVHVTAFVDRDASTAQTGSLDFMIGWNGANTLSQGVWMYYKRFMFHEGGDRTLQFATVTEVSQSHQDAMGDNLTATTNGAITSGSIDAVRVVVQYYVYDNG